MKKKVIAITITLLVATAGALTLVQCDHSNMARVTIVTKHYAHSLNKPDTSIIDKILHLFSSKLYAGSEWTLDKSSLELYINASDIQQIQASIPSPFEEYSIYVPAGQGREITLISYGYSTMLGDTMNNYGDRIITNLQPGEEKTINIVMKPMTELEDVSAGSTEISVIWYEGGTTYSIPFFQSYNIYRATDPAGPYQLIHTELNEFTQLHPDMLNLVSGVTYYYKVSISTTSHGEGLLSDYKSDTY